MIESNASVRPAATAFFVYSFLTAVFALPLFGRLSDAVWGEGGDSLAAVRSFWWTDYSAATGRPYEFPMVAYPFGLDQRASPATFLVYQSAAKLLRPFGSEILRFNLMMLLSFPLSGTAAFLLARRFVSGFWPPLLAGAAYGFSPYLWARSYVHVSLAHAEFLPIALLATLWVFERPRAWNALFLGIALAATTFGDPYYGYIGAVLVATVAGASWLARRRFTPEATAGLRPLLFVGAAAIVAVVLLSPLIVPVLRVLLDPSLRSTLGPLGYVRPAWEFLVYAAQPWQYLLPPPDHILLGPLVQGFWEAQALPGDTEFRLYVGVVPLLLAGLALSSAATRALSPERRLVRFAVTAMLAVAFFFSLAPRVWPFDALLPAVVPMFRVYARFGVGVVLAVALLAAFGLEHLLQRVNGHWRPALAVGIIALTLVDLVPRQPLKTYDATPPEPYAWLATLDPKTVLAEYPFVDDWDSIHSQYLFAQRVHEKALVNGSVTGTPLFALHETLRDLDDPETPGRLAALGVDYVLLHEDLYRSEKYLNVEPPDLTGNPAFELARSDGSLKVYRLLARPIELARDVAFEGGIRLLRAQAFVPSTGPEAAVTVTITLALPASLPPGHGLFVHLNDIAEQTVAQASVPLPPPNPWPPRLVTNEPGITFDLHLTAPEGLERERLSYRIGVTDGALRNLTITEGPPAVVGRRELPARGLIVRGAAPPLLPADAVRVQFADGLELLGFDPLQIDPARGTLQLPTLWTTHSDTTIMYTQFYHVLDEAGRLVAQQDQLHKRGRYPTSLWAVGELVPETVEVKLPPALPSGTYQVVVGLYDASTGQRLPVLSSTLPTSQNSAVLASFTLP